MHCPNCGQETEGGKFCTSCGAQLPNDEYAAAADPTINTPPQVQPTIQHEQTEQTRQSNESVEKLKTAGSNFGHFFVTLLKSPSEAKKANSNDLISSIATMVIFSLLIALGLHLFMSSFSSLVSESIPSGFFGGVSEPSISFFDSFVLPLIEFIILFLVVAALTFAGVKFSAQALTFTDVLSKYGAYQVPFLLLYAAGFLFALIGLTSLSIFLIMISMFGLIFIIPTIILHEQPAKGFDRIYVLLGIYFINLLLFSFFIQSFAKTFLSVVIDGMGGMFGGF
ncbi:hypothetical protein F3157_08235 [Virgibacillus dakarensis]|uniref:Zinc-ribbon domain-containing protein n=1 Tax=Lentibacillus populi TaxID=1827502 RepID=A0A9W5U1S6_9BACI|nr:zinc ribbon domain-containing protein [Lentibacillus populi]MBT2214741.1 hypothetical protein [Virgibacillus dakarensis]MTW85649.1 hypothetical protein [Virgibacillus dakarensis]GGB61789.1 hypothetical protein GCM10011409_43810 [Lentibacillus populi]